MKYVNDLRSNEKKKWLKQFGWSNSKHKMLEDCQMKFYYRYIHHWFLSGKELKEWKDLKELKTLPMYHGIHIADVIKDAINGKIHPSQMYSTYLGKINNITKIVEVHNRLISKEDLNEKKEIYREKAKKNIEIFRTKVYPEVKRIYDSTFSRVEKWEMVNIHGRKYYCIPDYLGKDATTSTYHMYDWKTGKTPDEDVKFQMKTYAVALHHSKYRIPHHDTVLHAVYLSENEKSFLFKITDEDFSNAYEDMMSYHDEMLEISLHGKFEASPEELRCAYCPYATICDDGRVYISTR